MKYILCFLLFSITGFSLSAQQYKLVFQLIDEQNLAIESATVVLNKKKTYVTDTKGKVSFWTSGSQQIQINHVAYETKRLKLNIYSDTLIHVMLSPKISAIREVEVIASRGKNETLKKLSVTAEQLSELRGNTLMSKLEYLPGVASIDIGQGFSKPVIRGLSANRVAVSENGIKQQGQQWGMDHGLEIDPYAVEQITIVKGPSSLEYGSDAIGGVISIIPQKRIDDGLETSVVFNARTNNNLLGASAGTYFQKDAYFIKGRVSYQDYGDYRVPAATFNYLGHIKPIYDKRLKNTAGKDNSLQLATGLKMGKVESSLTLSNVYGKMGFFAGAHGIPIDANLQPDNNSRNIELPYQRVNHFKVINNNTIKGNDNSSWNIDLGYQHNHRQEYATPHSHDARPLPQSTLELDFRLQTYTGSVKWKKYFSERASITSGLNLEIQDNEIDGYSFLLPRFEQQSGGLFSIMNYTLNKDITLQAGIRYDYGKIHVHGHVDDYVVEGLERAKELNKDFNSFSFNLGSSLQLTSSLNLKANLGRSFRMPTANELAANGVHHGTFRYETGNPNLKPETAYQADASLLYENKIISISLSGFASYFDNYIYLDPTGKYSIELPNGESIMLPDVGQIYKYTGGRTFRWGGESDITVKPTHWLTLKNSVEYVYAADVEHRYPIPFTPPLGVVSSAIWGYKQLNKIISGGDFTISHKFNAAQKRIRNEEITSSSHTFDVLLKSDLALSKKTESKIIIGVNNIFNTRYYNHISFYRHLELPEAARNATITLVFTFK